jgi:glycosyltransferase involved in cell wall biosynthesis
VLPARNEAAHISACLQSIFDNNFPKALLEILVLDDHSEDATAELVRQVAAASEGTLRLLQLASCAAPGFSGKKKAIEWAVSEATGALIVCTDADCIVPPDWLGLLVSLYETKRPGAIAGPVLIHREQRMLQRFQALDMAGMMGITAAGLRLNWHTMGNGANLCYPKATFQAVGGFGGSHHLASGDDFFLLQKIARRAPVFFLKNKRAAVRTEAPPRLSGFLQQRLRWGTKNAYLPDWGAKAALGLVLLCCSSIAMTAVLVLCQLIPLWLLLAQLGFKALADFILLREVCIFFGRRGLLRWFWPSFCIHTGYIVVTGFASLILSRYTWKGRRQR